MFIETPRFPLGIRYGFTQSSTWSETITGTTSGFEDRNRNWQRSVKVFNVTVGPNMADDVLDCYEFWESMAGPDVGFRFRDWADWKSCRSNASPAATDQPLILIPGSPGGGWQLTKQYARGAAATLRTILKPVQGTIKIADVISGVPHLKVEGSDYFLDYTTGLATLFFSPGGTPTWGGEFDVPVRFDSDFPLQVVAHEIQTVVFQLKELLNPSPDD